MFCPRAATASDDITSTTDDFARKVAIYGDIGAKNKAWITCLRCPCKILPPQVATLAKMDVCFSNVFATTNAMLTKLDKFPL